mgnify:FL=1|jgi:hypothetical protein
MFEQMAVSELSLGDKPMNDITQNQPVTEVGTYLCTISIHGSLLISTTTIQNMSSRTPDDGTESSRGSEGIWHPAHEWLENDELDTEYHPALEPSEHDGAWEDDIPNEDQQMGSGVASGRTNTWPSQ